ncbi:hypothetical protein N9L47_05680 [Rhodobacteraceae bacterium]|nr:hypothetical protein [Paracoccaceae bacterium]
MRTVNALLTLGILAGCGGAQSPATFICLNGPDIGVQYDDDQVKLMFSGGRVETLQNSPDRPNLYTAPDITWQITGFRQGRLNDGQSSLRCDEVG